MVSRGTLFLINIFRSSCMVSIVNNWRVMNGRVARVCVLVSFALVFAIHTHYSPRRKLLLFVVAGTNDKSGHLDADTSARCWRGAQLSTRPPRRLVHASSLQATQAQRAKRHTTSTQPQHHTGATSQRNSKDLAWQVRPSSVLGFQLFTPCMRR